jgi:hypothetical protein
LHVECRVCGAIKQADVFQLPANVYLTSDDGF